ncbi:pyridoxamine 5'-phosphate oxidase family protein [Mariniluteicoccus flavus]
MTLDRMTRYPDRSSTDRDDLNRLLDEQFVGTLSSVVDGMPWSLPLLFVRDGDRILLHGSTGAGLLRHVADGAPVTFTVTSVDGIVIAHSAFDSSANYRSAVLRGVAEPVVGAAATAAMEHLTDALIPGRTREVRASTRRELAATLVLALPIDAYVYKSRDGLAGDPDEATDAWYGVVPLRTVAGEPRRDPSCAAEVPPSVEALVRRFG